MKIASFLTLATLALAAISMPAQAQSNRALGQLSALNRIDPMQNPEFETADDIVGRKIIDRKNKVIGNVDDVIINQNGTISSIQTELDRLRLGDDINLNYRTLRIRSISNAYALNMDSDEIAELYPQLLANMETASGDNADTFSTRKLIGATLRSKDGRKLGKVDSILFSSNGGLASAVYADMSYGTLRGEKLAVPFRAITFASERGRLNGFVENDVADAMIALADD